MKLESMYQANLIKKLKELLPGAIILKNNANYLQGIPDLIVLYDEKWVALECKRGKSEKHQPNQDFYVSKKMDAMGLAKFIYPENETAVINEILDYLTH